MTHLAFDLRWWMEDMWQAYECTESIYSVTEEKNVHMASPV